MTTLLALAHYVDVTGPTGAGSTTIQISIPDDGTKWQSLIAYFTLLAALVAIFFTQRAWRHSLEPTLVPQFNWSDSEDGKLIDLAIYNAGGGVAVNAFFIIVANGHRVMDHVGDGFIRAGDKVTIKTSIRAASDQICMVQYQGTDGPMWTASRGIRRRKLSYIWLPWRRDPPSWKTDDLWRYHHPETSFTGLPYANCRLEWDRLGTNPDPVK